MHYNIDIDASTLVLLERDGVKEQQRDNFERTLVRRTLEENNWNRVRSADQLKISRMALFNLVKKHNIKVGAQ